MLGTRDSDRFRRIGNTLFVMTSHTTERESTIWSANGRSTHRIRAWIVFRLVVHAVLMTSTWTLVANADDTGNCETPTETTAAEASPMGRIVGSRAYEIPAWSFERGNAKVFTTQWADAAPMIAFGGENPWMVEYEIPIPVDAVSGTYTISIQYAAFESRPLTLLFDETKVGSVCGNTTGSWNTSTAIWEPVLTQWIAPGTHTLRLMASSADFPPPSGSDHTSGDTSSGTPAAESAPQIFLPPPHLVAIRVEISGNTTVQFPADWKLERPKARKIDAPFTSLLRSLTMPTKASVRRLLDDYATAFGKERFTKFDTWQTQLNAIPEENVPSTQMVFSDENVENAKRLVELSREIAMANPLLDFDSLLFVERKANSPSLGLPMNWQSNSSLARDGFDDRIALLNIRTNAVEKIYQPGGKYLGEVDLDFDASRILFSMTDSRKIWQVWEMPIHGGEPKPLTGEEPDVESYDACYLPDGDIIYSNTSAFVGVPCVNGDSHVSMLYRLYRDSDGNQRKIRQLCFEQEHDWNPVVMNSGRMMYTRWEYTDTPHSNTRLLFSMNPDGTGQMEYIGSNSYWPNSFFFARPIPEHPSKVVAVVSGHHDNPRMGELVVFDPVRGRQENQPAIQRIPGFEKPVPMIIRDGLTLSTWPKFLHPWPLNEHYFLVSCKPSASANWGIYLVDTFDNFTLLYESNDNACFEPIPFKPRAKPPVLADKTDLSKQTATVYIADIYAGGGLQGIPRGTVKSLRIGTYNFSFQNMGGLYGVVGSDGPWDVRRTVGTVPVNPDGSAKFIVPANIPLMFQPLDEHGAALQLMRSWSTAMPGEIVQCTGCHEKQNTTAPVARYSIALDKPADKIVPWRGPMRGFSFAREVQPILDHYCIQCHDGTNESLPDFRGDVKLSDWASVMPGNGGYAGNAGKFTVGYTNLTKYVRRPGIESDYHMLEPMEFHVGTTQLFQTLHIGTADDLNTHVDLNTDVQKNMHYGVKLDPESVDRLTVWIDFNAPFHGSWSGQEDAAAGVDVSMWDTTRQSQRRRELLLKYANTHDDPEAIIRGDTPLAGLPPFVADPKWVAYAKSWKPKESTIESPKDVDLSTLERKAIHPNANTTLELVKIPTMDGHPAIWMAVTEVTNAVYQCYDPRHDSRVEDKPGYQFGIHGMPANLPEQPVVRVSNEEAERFCRWLSEQTGEHFRLPTEEEWRYAAMAETSSRNYTTDSQETASQRDFWFGMVGDDFSTFENFADKKLSEYVTDPYTVDQPLQNPPKYDDWIPKDSRYQDGSVIAVAPGRYRPNPWGLYDVHGNVQEWTSTTLPDGRRIACGGSWRDQPSESAISVRRAYQPYQRVFNVGFRVVLQEP